MTTSAPWPVTPRGWCRNTTTLGHPYNVANVTSLSSKHNLAGFGITPNSTIKQQQIKTYSVQNVLTGEYCLTWSCSLVEISQHFWNKNCIHPQGDTLQQGASTDLWNVSKFQQTTTAQYPRRQQSSQSAMWEPHALSHKLQT